MKIAMVSEHASPLAALGGVDAGGQNVHVAALACTLARFGHRVTVYTRRDDAALPDAVDAAPGVRVEHIAAGPARYVPKDALLPFMDGFADALAERWRCAPPDVVHAHFWMSGYAARAAARPLGIPLVQTYHALGVEKRRHQGAADTSPEERLAIEATLARGADRIIATASAEVFELRRIGAPPRALRVVPCGVDCERFTPEGPREARSSRLRIVTVSRLVPRKGVADVIEALTAVPDAELVIAGGAENGDLASDAEARRLREIAVAGGVAERVVFRGQVARDDMPGLLRSADVVACTPWYEPFGIVPLEAMACGVPVVVSAVGGLIDTVKNGVTGLHVPPRDPSAIAAALRALAADDVRREALGRAGRARVRERYAWTRIAAETLDVYRSVVARTPAQPRRAL